jgi:hypothetical protein
MPEFGRRQQHPASNRARGETPDTISWLVCTAVAIVLIASSFLGYRFLNHPANGDPLLEEHESLEEMVQRHASDEELLRQYPSLDTRTIPIAYGNKIYKIPHNYLVELNRPNGDPNDTSFEIHVLLPDLVPRTAVNADRFVSRPYYHGYEDQVNATIRVGQKELDWSERRLLWERWCADKGPGVFHVVDSGYKLCEIANNDLFLKDTAEGPLIFACDKITDKGPGCTLAEPTEAQYGALNLEFSRKYVYQADEIRRRFQSLLDSFVER